MTLIFEPFPYIVQIQTQMRDKCFPQPSLPAVVNSGEHLRRICGGNPNRSNIFGASVCALCTLVILHAVHQSAPMCTKVYGIGGRKCKEENIAETSDLETAHRSTEEEPPVAKGRPHVKNFCFYNIYKQRLPS